MSLWYVVNLTFGRDDVVLTKKSQPVERIYRNERKLIQEFPDKCFQQMDIFGQISLSLLNVTLTIQCSDQAKDINYCSLDIIRAGLKL